MLDMLVLFAAHGSAGEQGGMPPSAPATPSPRSNIFVGPNGVRAGWRLLLFLGVAVVYGWVLGVLARRLGRGIRGFTPFALGLADGVPFLAIFLSALTMGALEKRSLAHYGLPLRQAFGADFWKGAAWGFLALSALLLLLRAHHNFYFGALALSGPALAKFAGAWAVAFLLVGFFEEFLFRGYSLFTLSSGMGFWRSAILLSILFGAVHLRNPGEEWIGGMAAALIGLFFCLTLRRTGSLWFAVGLHASWDYAESFLYSVPDSGAVATGHLLNSSFQGSRWLTGGSVGPEGSVLVFVIIGLMFVAFDRLYRDARFPPSAVSDRPSRADLSLG